MSECHGLLSIAFRRSYIANGTCKFGTNLPNHVSSDISGKWITSPYCQIEPSMAFQIDMPILIFREKGVIDEGILDKGAIGYYMPDFDLEQIDEYFKGLEWNELISEWKAAVLAYQEKKKFEEFEAHDIIKHIISCSICEEKEISPKELYDAFKQSIKRSGWNDYRLFSSRIDPDKKIENRYERKYSSMLSDYIAICQTIF